MTGTERIAHMKEQMRPSEELVDRVREQVNAAPSVSTARRTWIPRVAAACAAAAVIAAAAWDLPQTGQSEHNINDMAGVASGRHRRCRIYRRWGGWQAQKGETTPPRYKTASTFPKSSWRNRSRAVTVDMIGSSSHGEHLHLDGQFVPSKAQEALCGANTGRTKGNIDEWSKQDDTPGSLPPPSGIRGHLRHERLRLGFPHHDQLTGRETWGFTND